MITKVNPQDVLKIELAESERYSGSNWCAEMFDKFDISIALSDPALTKSLNFGGAWVTLAKAGLDLTGGDEEAAKLFNEVTTDSNLEAEMKTIPTSGEMIALAKKRGKTLSREALLVAARHVQKKWLQKLPIAIQKLFEAAAKDPKLASELRTLRSEEEIITVAGKAGIKIEPGELDALNLKLDRLRDDESNELMAVLLAMDIVRTRT